MEVSYKIECDVPVRTTTTTTTITTAKSTTEESTNGVTGRSAKTARDSAILRRKIQKQFVTCAVQSEITIHISDSLVTDFLGIQDELNDHYSYIFEKSEEAITRDIEQRKQNSDSELGTQFKVTALIGEVIDEPYSGPWNSTLPWKTAIKPAHVTGFYLPRRIGGQDPLEGSSKIQMNIFYVTCTNDANNVNYAKCNP